MSDKPTPSAITAEAAITDDQIQYRVMILRGTGNPITADLIEALDRERKRLSALIKAREDHIASEAKAAALVAICAKTLAALTMPHPLKEGEVMVLEPWMPLYDDVVGELTAALAAQAGG